MNQTLANVTAFVRTGINEPGSSACGFQHLGMVSLAASGGGREALTKLMLGNPFLSHGAGIQSLSNAGECFIVHSWVPLGTNW